MRPRLQLAAMRHDEAGEQREHRGRSTCRQTADEHLNDNVVAIDLNQPMASVLAELSKHPVKTRLSLTGTLVVARDLAHAKIKAMMDEGKPMPEYLKNHANIVAEVLAAKLRTDSQSTS